MKERYGEEGKNRGRADFLSLSVRKKAPSYAALLLALLGISLLVLSIEEGRSSAGVIFVFPFVITTSPKGVLGSVLIFFAFFLHVLSIHNRFLENIAPEYDENNYERVGIEETPMQKGPDGRYAERTVEKRTEGAGVIFLGPVPILWGVKNPHVRSLLTWIGLLLFLLWFFFFLYTAV